MKISRITLRAQSSVESIVIFSLLLIILIIIITASSDSISNYRYVQANSLLDSTLAKSIDTADYVYLQGSGSKQKLFIELPNSMNNTVINASILELHILGEDGNIIIYARGANQQLAGTFPSTPGRHLITVTANDTHAIFS
ncbi:MAG: hypothetical protein ACI8Y7_000120 [Candidatus Woesearchaeota archaeon]|jgi:hypothetical protein